MTTYRVTLVVDMDIEADDPDTAFDFVHDIATRDNDFTVVDSFDPIDLSTPIIHDCPNCGGHPRE